MTTPQLPPLPEQSMTHPITDEQIFAVADEHADGGHGPVGEPADWYGFEQKSLLECIRAVLALAAPAPQGEPMTDTERADMICAVAAICTGTSSRNLAATAIEWTERRYGITAPAGGEQPAAHQATKEPSK